MDWTAKQIKGFPGYMVSNYGEVFTNKRGKKMYRFKQYIRDGYYHVNLIKNGKYYAKRTSRLVAEVFVDNPDKKNFVDHIDTNKKNNRADNLRWVTYSENMRNPITYKRINLAKEKEIEQLDKAGVLIKKWSSTKLAAKTLGISKTAINNCLCNRSNSSGGYKWRFV